MAALVPHKLWRKSTAVRRWLWLAAALMTAERQARLFANPTGMTVGAGAASAQSSGSQLNVTVSSAALLNWSTFNIQAGETTTFIQPSANSVVLNAIGGRNPSQIFGSLNANGTVILANANGFYFGPNSMIKVGGDFIATTAPLTPDFGLGTSWQFTGLPPLASIVNYGQIQAGDGRALYLIAENIENHGSLNAPGGDIGLYGGESVLVSESPDGRALSATVKVPAGSVDNLGRITADAGTIALQAQVVNQNGVLQANSVREENGVIELVASDTLNLGPNSAISACGDDSAGGSAGGLVTLRSGNVFSDAAGSQITTAGGAQGGNGGNVEVSAPNIQSLASSMDASAASGWNGGQLWLDPVNINLVGSGSSTTAALPNGSGTVDGSSTTASSTWNLNVDTAFKNKNFSEITLEASGNLTLSTAWNLIATTGENSGQLTLEAGGNILFAKNAQINGTQASDPSLGNWSVTLDAGYSFSQNAVQSGLGNIYLNGSSGGSVNGSILTARGPVNLTAGQDIQIGAGYINTTGGGGITLAALAGSINAGTANLYKNGYVTQPVYPYNVGGIATLAGGNVTLSAGNNIISNPSSSGEPAGSSGAYGAGNVTLSAGSLIYGNYQVTDGLGTILAGVTVANGLVTGILNANGGAGYAPAGLSPEPLTLSLVSGSWNVWAAKDVYLEEVRNPSGTFDANDSYPYNYAPTAALNVWAGNAITLDGTSLGNGRNAYLTQPVYPPVMNLSAGAGGITLNNSIILFPSSEGALQITTSDGGNLVGNSTAIALTGITMSDGDPSDYTTFALGHAGSPLHADDPNPVLVHISGSIETFGLTVPAFADITVDGSTYNFGFSGQNVSAAQTTSNTVAGSITYRGDLTSVPLTDALPAELLNYNLSGLPEVATKLQYNATTGTLTFVGVMTPAELQFLLNPTVVAVDSSGQPVLDANGNQVYTTVTLAAAQTAALQQLFTATQSATLSDQGLGISGPGHFNISAGSIDLGISGGIFATAPDAGLAAISPDCADINVTTTASLTTTGDLSMTASKIANAGLLGGINLMIGGTLNVGDNYTTVGDPSVPKGIFTESGGNISVLTGKDVNLDSSRIAAYNGGNVTVESLNGNVNAGNGGAGYVNVDGVQLDAQTGGLAAIPTVGIPGSGILATTLPGSDARLGNILVETPKGNITSSQGGVLQISFNGTDASAATAVLLAGYELHDAQGNWVSGADASDPIIRGTLITDTGTAPTRTVLINNEPVTVSASVWPELLALLGLSPGSGQVLKVDVTAEEPAFVAALNGPAGALDAFRYADFISPARNVDASGSGIVAQNVVAEATGEASGLYVGFKSVFLVAQQIGPGKAFGPTVTDDQDPGGTGPVIQVISTAPTVEGISVPSAAPPTVSAPKEVATVADDAATVTAKTDQPNDDPAAKKNKGKEISLARRVSRVSVLLPQHD